MMPDFSSVKVLVVGDAILDEYVYGKVDRISPEAPVPVLTQSHNEFRLGGAANVASNCAALGSSVTLFSFCGNDSDASMIEKMCDDRGVSPIFAKNDRRHTSRKTRFVSENHQMLRVDKESSCSISVGDFNENMLLSIIKDVDVVIVSDYNKGSVTIEILDWLRENHDSIVVDPKPIHCDLYHGVKLITPNKKEAAKMMGVLEEDLDDHCIETLGFKFNSNVLVTLGEEGMKYCELHKSPIHFPAVAQEVFDVTGAGDTVISIVSLAIAKGMEIKVACELANRAAAQVVAKFGTATINPSTLEF
jgi:rfaE bifunctional protein kinase chain/domain